MTDKEKKELGKLQKFLSVSQEEAREDLQAVAPAMLALLVSESTVESPNTMSMNTISKVSSCSLNERSACSKSAMVLNRLISTS